MRVGDRAASNEVEQLDLDVVLAFVKSPVTNVDAVGVPVLTPKVDIANARVTFAGGKPVVTDGPFPETKEVLGGYWMIRVKSKQEASVFKWSVLTLA